MRIEKYMKKHNLKVNLEEEAKIAMEYLRKEFESDGYDTEIDLIDVWLDKYGHVFIYGRGEEPSYLKEDDMIQIGHIDNDDLWIY